jgi:hypothetical protein
MAPGLAGQSRIPALFADVAWLLNDDARVGRLLDSTPDIRALLDGAGRDRVGGLGDRGAEADASRAGGRELGHKRGSGPYHHRDRQRARRKLGDLPSDSRRPSLRLTRSPGDHPAWEISTPCTVAELAAR